LRKDGQATPRKGPHKKHHGSHDKWHIAKLKEQPRVIEKLKIERKEQQRMSRISE
jgi:hypothetical protein